MIKQVGDCQKTIAQAIQREGADHQKTEKTMLSSVYKGLTICISKVPSKNGFPFDLPAVNYVDKLYLSHIYIKEALAALEDSTSY